MTKPLGVAFTQRRHELTPQFDAHHGIIQAVYFLQIQICRTKPNSEQRAVSGPLERTFVYFLKSRFIQLSKTNRDRPANQPCLRLLPASIAESSASMFDLENDRWSGATMVRRTPKRTVQNLVMLEATPVCSRVQ